MKGLFPALIVAATGFLMSCAPSYAGDLVLECKLTDGKAWYGREQRFEVRFDEQASSIRQSWPDGTAKITPNGRSELEDWRGYVVRQQGKIIYGWKWAKSPDAKIETVIDLQSGEYSETNSGHEVHRAMCSQKNSATPYL